MSNRRFVTVLDQHFAGAMPEVDYVAGTSDVVAGLGFAADNTLAALPPAGTRSPHH